MRRCRSKSAGRAGLVGALCIAVVACVTYWAAPKLAAAPSDKWVSNPFPGWSLPSSLNQQAKHLADRLRNRRLTRAGGSPAAPNTALHFDGIDDRVTFGAAPGLNVTTFTIETWFKREGSGSTATA